MKRSLVSESEAPTSEPFSFGFDDDNDNANNNEVDSSPTVTKLPRISSPLPPVPNEKDLFAGYDSILSNFTTTPYCYVVARDYVYNITGCVVQQGQIFKVDWLQSGTHQLCLHPLQLKPHRTIDLFTQFTLQSVNKDGDKTSPIPSTSTTTSSTNKKPLDLSILSQPINILTFPLPLLDTDVTCVSNTTSISVPIANCTFIATPNQQRIYTALNTHDDLSPSNYSKYIQYQPVSSQNVDRTDNVSAYHGDYWGKHLIALFPFLYNMPFPTTSHRYAVDMYKIAQEACQNITVKNSQQIMFQRCTAPLSVDTSLNSWIWPLSPQSFLSAIYTRSCYVVQCGGKRLQQYIQHDFEQFNVAKLLAQSSTSIIWMKSAPQKAPITWLGQTLGDRSVSYLPSTPEMSYHAYLAGHTIYFNPPENIQAKYVKNLTHQLGHIFGYLPVGSDSSLNDDDENDNDDSDNNNNNNNNNNTDNENMGNNDDNDVKSGHQDSNDNNVDDNVKNETSKPAAKNSSSGGTEFLDEMGSFGGDLEIFAVAGPHVTPWHLDAQDNFSIQLTGTKKWQVIRGPINASTNFHPKSTSKRALVADKHTLQCDAEATSQYYENIDNNSSTESPTITLNNAYQNSTHNKSPMFSALLDNHPDKETFIAYPGTIFYHPAGTYHRVDALDEDSGSLSINISLDVLRYSDLILQFLAKPINSHPLLRQRVSLSSDITSTTTAGVNASDTAGVSPLPLTAEKMVPALLQTILTHILPQIISDMTTENVFIPALITGQQIHDFSNLSPSTGGTNLDNSNETSYQQQAQTAPHLPVPIPIDFAVKQILWREHGCVNFAKYIAIGGLRTLYNKNINIQQQNVKNLQGFCSKLNSFVTKYLPIFFNSAFITTSKEYVDAIDYKQSNDLELSIPISSGLSTLLTNIELIYNPFVHLVENEPAWLEAPTSSVLSQLLSNLITYNTIDNDQHSFISQQFTPLFQLIKQKHNSSSIDLSSLPLLITSRRMFALYHFYSICIASGCISTSSNIPFSSDASSSSTRNPPGFTIGLVLNSGELSLSHKAYQTSDISTLRKYIDSNMNSQQKVLDTIDNKTTEVVNEEKIETNSENVLSKELLDELPTQNLWQLHTMLFINYLIQSRIECKNFYTIYQYVEQFLLLTANIYQRGFLRDDYKQLQKHNIKFVHYVLPCSIQLIQYLANIIAIFTHLGIFQQSKK